MRDQRGIYLSQRKYVANMSGETGMCNARPAETPLETGIKLQSDEEPMEDASRYRRLVDKLIYFTVTRPDISFVVSLISQFMQYPKAPHWNAIRQILRYFGY